MSMLGLGVAGGRRRTYRRGGGYYNMGGMDPMSFPRGGARKTRRAELKAMSVGTLRKMLKKLGLKTTGVKATLVGRLNYAPRVGGGVETNAGAWDGGWDRHGLGGTDYRSNIRGT